MRILAIDPGFERMGIAVVEKDKTTHGLSVIYSTCTITSREDAFEKRLQKIGAAVKDIVRSHSPNALAIEKLFFNSNQKTALLVAEARGVAIYEATRGGLPVFEYTPLQIKTAVVGYGRASKQQVIFMVEKLVSFKTNTSNKKRAGRDDEFDAIAVGITYFACENTRKN